MAEIKDNNRVIFIISHKYYRGYESYLDYYINNIKKNYENHLIVVVDNNSNYKEDVFSKIKNLNNVVLLENNINSKFEIGAYTVGLDYLIGQNVLINYDYIVLTQDTFILKNKVDFNVLHDNNVKSCPINSYIPDGMFEYISRDVLSSIGLYDNMDHITFCWCNSFIVSSDNAQKLYNYIKDINVINYPDHWKQDMISEAVYDMVRYMGNYDVDKMEREYNESGKIPDPFAYFSSYARNGIVRSLKEKKVDTKKYVHFLFIENIDQKE
jgi:hypothetical protein